MAQYIKPVIKLTTIENTVRPAGSCTTSGEDLKLLEEVFGIGPEDWSTAFSTEEPCQVQYDIDEYCKFTSVNNGIATVILQS